jgi:two-component system, chemotaxis family, sensor kinase Cph1
MTRLKEVSDDFTQLRKNAGGCFKYLEEEFRQAQLELEESRHDYADLFDRAPAGYFVFNRRGLLEKVNLAGARMLGTHEDTMEGRPVLTFFPKASYPAFFDHLAGAFAMRDKQVCELELLRADGSTFWAQFVTAPITDAAGDFVHFRTIVVDINDRKC